MGYNKLYLMWKPDRAKCWLRQGFSWGMHEAISHDMSAPKKPILNYMLPRSCHGADVAAAMRS